MPSFQQKIMRLVKKCDVLNNRAEKQTTETVSEGAQILDIADKDFETTAVKVFKELKETTFKELKESMMMTAHQIENIN